MHPNEASAILANIPVEYVQHIESQNIILLKIGLCGSGWQN